MKTMLLAAAAALSLGIGSAYADSEGGQVQYPIYQIPGFLAQAPAQNAPAVATAQNGQAARAYVTQSSHGTWLFRDPMVVRHPANPTHGGAERPAPLPAFFVVARQALSSTQPWNVRGFFFARVAGGSRSAAG